MNKTNYILELCNRPEMNIDEIDCFLKECRLSPEEITVMAHRVGEHFSYDLSPHDLLTEEDIETKLTEIFDVFLKHGLLPNLIVENRAVLQEIRYIYYGNAVPVIARMLMEHGGDPNLRVDGETIFEELDFDIIFDVTELENKKLFDAEFKLWLVMIGYGGKIKNGISPVELKNGYRAEMFKQFERFDYRIEFLGKDWIMYIFNKENGEVAAVLS